jgi:glycosyltransferase involved in cell wall biosynthesis
MKILHLDDERWDSGLTHYALEIAGLLAAAGHTIVFGAREGATPAARAKDLGLPVFSFSSIPSLAGLIRSEKWDVINAHTGRMHSWSLVLRAGRVPVIRTRGDARTPRSSPLNGPIYRRTAATIAASDHIARMCLENLPISEDKMHTIYPGFEPVPYVTPLNERVGMLGRLDPVKGHTVFLEAAALVLKRRPQTRFVIAGAEANLSFDLLSNQIKALGIEHAIDYAGRVPSAISFMQSCGVGVIASIGSEEISRACLEWMSAGRAVIGTLVGCLPELIEPGETGLIVAPEDSAALAKALLTCLQHPDETKKWGEQGRRRLERHFSKREQLERTLAVYERGK